MRKTNLRMRPNNRLRRYVIEELVKGFSITPIIAGKLVKNSSFNLMLKKNPDFVMHSSSNYWAKKVVDEARDFIGKS